MENWHHSSTNQGHETSETHGNTPIDQPTISYREWSLISTGRGAEAFVTITNRLTEVTKGKPHEKQWASHNALLQYIGRVFSATHPESPYDAQTQYNAYARTIHNRERDRVLDSTQNMSLESQEDREKQWQIHQAFLAHIRDVSPHLLPEYTRAIHDRERYHILSHTAEMSLELPEDREKQWHIHQAFLAHIRDVSPHLLPHYTQYIRNQECTNILSHTAGMSLESKEDREKQWHIHQAFLTRIRDVSPQLLPHYTREIRNRERDRIVNHVDMMPGPQRAQWYKIFLDHVRDVSPELEQENIRTIYNLEFDRATSS